MINETRRPRDLDADEAAAFAEIQRHMAPRRPAGVCPEPGRMMAAQAGILPDAEADTILAHLAMCPACQSLIEALTDPEVGTILPEEGRRIDIRVRDATAVPARGGRVLPFRRGARWVGLTALGTAAAATLLFVVIPRRALDSLALPVVASPPALVAETPPHVSMLNAERLATSEMGLASVSWRGDASDARPVSAFDVAREAFDRGDFAEAERRLAAITDRTPRFADAWLLLGASRLLLGEAAAAIAPLERARTALVGSARDDATWHLAVALHEARRDAEARDVLSPLCADRNERASMACLALDELRAP
jgi:hypothetical protein